jgi:hypothetical protein
MLAAMHLHITASGAVVADELRVSHTVAIAAAAVPKATYVRARLVW